MCQNTMLLLCKNLFVYAGILLVQDITSSYVIILLHFFLTYIFRICILVHLANYIIHR